MRDLRSGDLVAVWMPPGPAWLELVRDAWDAGAAVFPLDHRLPRPEMDRRLSAARPTVVFDGVEPTRRKDGIGVQAGIGLLIATSGTTGEPKLVELTRDAVTAAVEASAARLGATADDPWLLCLPVGHIGGMLVLLRGRILGSPLVIHPGFDPPSFEEAVRAGVRFTSVVPTMLFRLMRDGVDLAGLRAMLVGGGALGFDAPRPPVVTTYGMTETCGGVVYDGEPLDGVEVRIGAGDRIEVRSATLLAGYRPASDPAVTPDGWFGTADAGVIEHGRLRVFGRLDDVILTGGEKVWPSEVEAALLRDPGVAAVRVVGRPDPEWGQAVVAVIVPSDPADPPSRERLRDAVVAALPRHAAPKRVELVDELREAPAR